MGRHLLGCNLLEMAAMRIGGPSEIEVVQLNPTSHLYKLPLGLQLLRNLGSSLRLCLNLFVLPIRLRALGYKPNSRHRRQLCSSLVRTSSNSNNSNSKCSSNKSGDSSRIYSVSNKCSSSNSSSKCSSSNNNDSKRNNTSSRGSNSRGSNSSSRRSARRRNRMLRFVGSL